MKRARLQANAEGGGGDACVKACFISAMARNRRRWRRGAGERLLQGDNRLHCL